MTTAIKDTNEKSEPEEEKRWKHQGGGIQRRWLRPIDVCWYRHIERPLFVQQCFFMRIY